MSPSPHVLPWPAQTHEWGTPGLFPQEMVPVQEAESGGHYPRAQCVALGGTQLLEAEASLLRDGETDWRGRLVPGPPSRWVTEDARLTYLAGQVQVQEPHTCVWIPG